MTINGKIEAMKAIRSLKVQLIESTLDSGHTVQRVMVGSLRDVKDIVEAIMEFSQNAVDMKLRGELHEAHAELMNLRTELDETKACYQNMQEDFDEFNRIKDELRDEKARNQRLMARLQSIHVALED